MTLRIATMRLPKQMDPKEYEVARLNESMTALEQHDLASTGEYHHVPTVPLTVTVVIFLMTSEVQYKLSKNKMYVVVSPNLTAPEISWSSSRLLESNIPNQPRKDTKDMN